MYIAGFVIPVPAESCGRQGDARSRREEDEGRQAARAFSEIPFDARRLIYGSFAALHMKGRD